MGNEFGKSKKSARPDPERGAKPRPQASSMASDEDVAIEAENEARRVASGQAMRFGSDGPYLHPGVELYKVRLLGLKPEKLDLILGKNALRLLRVSRVGQTPLTNKWRTMSLPAVSRNRNGWSSGRQENQLPPGVPVEHEL
jgi:hypothetical protein